MKLLITKDTTNVTLLVFVQDSSSTTGDGLTGIVAADLSAYFARVEDDNDVTVTEISLSDLSGTGTDHADGGWEEISPNMPGWYRFDIPDAAVATGARSCGISLTDAGDNDIAQVPIEIQLIDVDLEDSVRGGMTALPNVNAGSAGGVPTDTDGNGAVRIVDGTGARELNTSSGVVLADIVLVSANATAANNLQSQYDGTGLTGDTFPATQAQVGNIATGAGGLSALISAFAKVGAEPETNTFTATQQGDEVYHIVEDDGGNTDFYYQATVGAGAKATAFEWRGYVQSNGDSVSVWYWDWVSTTYKQVESLPGSNGTTPFERRFLVPVGATGTGADEGKVRLRFLSTTTTAIATDRLLCEFTQASQSVGYANGQIWIDSNSANTNTVSFVDGVADNVAGSWANAITLSGQVGLTDFHIINNSTIALTGTSDNFSLFGDNWILQLESRSVAGAYFQGAHVSGVGTSATEVHYEGCDVSTMSVQIGHFDFCSFSGTVTHTLAGDYNYHNCYSMVAGPNGPTFAKTAGQAITAQWRGWAGSINLTGLEVGDTLTIGGTELGTIDLGSPAGAVVVEIRGIYKELTNVGSAAVNLDGAINAADVALILADTNELQADDVPGLIAALNNVAATDIVSAGAITTLSGAVVNVDLVDTLTTYTGNIKQTGDNFTRIGAAGASLTDLGGMSTGMKSEIESEANDALVALNLDHLMKTAVGNNADMTTEVVDGTVLSNIMSSSSDTSTYTVADDSLQGISEGAAGGGATAQQVWEYGTRVLTANTNLNDLDAAGIRTAVGLASANLDTQLADIPTVAEFNARTLVAASYFDAANDTVVSVTTVGTVTNDVTTDAASRTASKATGYAVAGDAMTLTAGERTTLADVILVRAVQNVEDSADKHSLGALIMFVTNWSISGATLTAKKPSDDSAFDTYTLSTTADVDPVTGVA